MFLTLAVRDVRPATPRARLVTIDLEGRDFQYDPRCAVPLPPMPMIPTLIRSLAPITLVAEIAAAAP